MLTRRLSSFSESARSVARLFSASSPDSINVPVARSSRPRAIAWSAILPFSLILLLAGCGGLSTTSKSAIVAIPATITFGSVTVGQTALAKITLQNQGFEAVQIDNLSVSGSGFSIAGTTSFPINLAAGASVTVELQFTPTASGSATEPIMITSSLSAVPTSVAMTTGTGVGGTSGGAPKVQLSWAAPDSPTDIIIGYSIYRSANGTGYQLLNSSIDENTSYLDSAAQSGSVYDYYVESVDAAGLSSPPSNSTTVTVP